MRVKFSKEKEREFIDKVLEKTGSPSLRELLNRGVDLNYSSLKNYYSERRSLPLNLFENLCKLSGINKNELDFEITSENRGQIIGGKKSRKRKRLNTQIS
ncbi:MAG: hypothetical protein Q8Q04_00020 [archaeon]|nr:hypothetical protein [archaeon]